VKYRFVDDVRAVSLQDPCTIELRKTFPAGDDVFSGPWAGDRVPNSIILEFIAMAGGYLVLQRLDWRKLPLLVRVAECRYEDTAVAGAPLTARARVHALSAGDPTMAEVTGDVHAGDRLVASGRLLYLCVPVPEGDLGAYRPGS
jgi:hypothetical protein